MSVQVARLANLRTVIRLLEQDGLVTRESQAEFLGSATTARKLQSMLEGTPISAMFAEHVEHMLFKPRGWMSDPHSSADLLNEFGPLISG